MTDVNMVKPKMQTSSWRPIMKGSTALSWQVVSFLSSRFYILLFLGTNNIYLDKLLLFGRFFKCNIQSTTRITEFFVVGILSVILVKFAILVGTKSLEETAFSSPKGRDTLHSVNRGFLFNKKCKDHWSLQSSKVEYWIKPLFIHCKVTVVILILIVTASTYNKSLL